MGVDVFIGLVDVRAYHSELLPAFRAFVDADDARPLIDLMYRVPVRPDDAPPARRLRDLSLDELQEEIALPPERVPFEPDERDALVAFVEGPEPRGDPRSWGGWWKRGNAAERRDFIRAEFASRLFDALCVPWNRGVRPWQNMGRTAFTPYLYEHSPYYEEIFTGGANATGGAMEFGRAECSDWVKHPVIARLREELANVPRPQEGTLLQRQYDNLGALLDLPLQDDTLAIVRTISA